MEQTEYNEPESPSFNDNEADFEVKIPEGLIEERDFLVEMLQKNQALVQNQQAEFVREKAEMVQQYKALQNEMQKQINSLQEENKALIKEITSSKNAETDFDVKRNLTREIQNLQNIYEKRVEDLNKENKKLQEDLKQMRDKIQDSELQYFEENNQLMSKLDHQVSTNKKLENSYIQTIKDLNQKLNEVQSKLAQCQRDLQKSKQDKQIIRKKTIMKMKTNPQKQFIHLSDQLEQSLISIQNFAEKEAQFTQHINDIDASKNLLFEKIQSQDRLYKASKKILENKNSELEKELEKLKQESSQEIEKLQYTNLRLIERTQDITTNMEKQVNHLKSQLEISHRSIFEKEGEFLLAALQEIKHMDDFEAIKEHQANLIKFQKVSSPMKQELMHLQDQLKHKHDQLYHTRELYQNAKHKERKNITNSIKALQQQIHTFNKQSEIVQNYQQQYMDYLKLLDEKACESEENQLQKIKELNEEIIQLNNVIRKFHEGQYESKFNEVSEVNIRLETENQELKDQILNLQKELKQLQNIIQNFQKAEEPDGYSEELKALQYDNNRYQLEIVKLQESNNQLKQFYSEKLTTLQNKLHKSQKEISELKQKQTNARNAQINRIAKELSTWRYRETGYNKLIKDLQEQVQRLTKRQEMLKKVTSNTQMLEDEELKLLRQEVGEKELWVESMKNEWQLEKKDILAENKRLSDVIKLFTQKQENYNQFAYKEYKDVLNYKNKLKSLVEKLYKEYKLNEESRNRQQRYSNENSQILENTYNEIMELAKDEIETLRKKLKDFDRIKQNEIQQYNDYNQTIIKDLQAMEKSLSSQILYQQDHIKDLSNALSTIQDMHSLQLDYLRQEISVFTQLTLDKPLRKTEDRQQFYSELEQLTELLNNKEEAFLDNIAQKIQKLQSIVEEQIIIDKNHTQNPKYMNTSEILKNVQKKINNIYKTIRNQDTSYSYQNQMIQSTIKQLKEKSQKVEGILIKDLNKLENQTDLQISRIKWLEEAKAKAEKQRDNALQAISQIKKSKRADKLGAQSFLSLLKLGDLIK